MTEKRKILFVAHHLTVGGAQKSLLTALRAIDYEQNEVTLYLRKNRTELLSEADPRVRVIVNGDTTRYYRRPYALWALFRMKICGFLKKNEKRERLHEALSERIREDMLREESARYFAGEKYDTAIAYVQGYSADIVADGVAADHKYLFYHSSTDEAHELHERIFASFDAIVGVNEGVRNVLREQYPRWRDKMTCLCNYVDAKEIMKKSREMKIAVPEGRCIFCTCGRLAAVKGFDLAVDAAKRLKDKGLAFLWYFVGDGPERKNLESAIREYGLENDIVITGMQSNPYPWLAACDIYVQSSYEEAQPLSVIEAQILCRPVISTATVGGRSLVGDGVNGLLCEITSADLADKMEMLMTDDALRERMRELLMQTDHSAAERQYREDWEKLLEGVYFQ